MWKQLAALWNTLSAQGFGYVLPPAAFEERGQKVRTPSQVVDAKLGTCLDTSLLCAACMEQIGLHPFLVFTRGHAFAGCWLVEEKFGSMLTDDVTALRKRLPLAWNRHWEWVMASDAYRTVYALEKAVAVLDDYAAALATLSTP